LSGSGLRQIKIDDERFRACRFHRLRRLLQIGEAPRDENERGEITRKTNGRRPANPLARSRDDGD
jgi:hypothetical protein